MPDLGIAGLTTIGTKSGNDYYPVVEFASGVTKKESRESLAASFAYDDTPVFYLDGSRDLTGSANFANAETGITWASTGNSIKDDFGGIIYTAGAHAFKGAGAGMSLEDGNFSFADGYGITFASASTIKENAGDLEISSSTGQVILNGDTDLMPVGIYWENGKAIYQYGGNLKSEGEFQINDSYDFRLLGGDIYVEADTYGINWVGGSSIKENSGVLNILATSNLNIVADDISSSTVVYLDASNNLVSLANSVGVFTNDGFGNFSWAASSTTFADSAFRIQDNVDATKQLAFEVSGISASTTRTLTVPNVNDTIAVLGTAQTFTAKQTFTTATTEMLSVSLLDTTYKSAIDVSSANTLRVGNGFTSLVVPTSMFSSGSLTITPGGFLTLQPTSGTAIIRTTSTSTGTLYGLQVLGSYTATAGATANYSSVLATPTINTATTGYVAMFNADPALITAHTGDVYGIRLNVASASKRWNVYATGDANSHFNHSIALGGTTLDGTATKTLTMYNGTAPGAQVTNAFQLHGSSGKAMIYEDADRYIVQADNSTKTTAAAPYTNDGYVQLTINGTTYKFMTTA